MPEQVNSLILDVYRTDDGYSAELVDSDTGRVIQTWPARHDKSSLTEAFRTAIYDSYEQDNALALADRYYEQGLTDRQRYFNELERRLKSGAVSNADIAQVQAELEIEPPRFLKNHLLRLLADGRAAAPDQMEST